MAAAAMAVYKRFQADLSDVIGIVFAKLYLHEWVVQLLWTFLLISAAMVSSFSLLQTNCYTTCMSR